MKKHHMMSRAVLLALAILAHGTGFEAHAASTSTSTTAPGSLAEKRGDRLFDAEHYMDAAREYQHALAALSFDVERLKQLQPGVVPYPKEPFRTAIVLRKWARATQLTGEVRYARTRQLPKETMLLAMFAASSASNLLEGLRESVALEEEVRAREIAAELRQAYDIQVELSFLVSSESSFLTKALVASNRARARSIFDAVWARQTLPMLTPQDTGPEERRLSLLIQIGEVTRTLLAEGEESEPRPEVIADLAGRLQRARTESESLGPASHSDFELLESGRLPGTVVGDLAGRSRLKVGEAVLQYHITDRFVFAFFVPEVGRLQMKILRPNARELHSLVESYARKLADPRLPWKQTSTELYVELLSVFDHMIEDLDHLFVVPSGFLHQVPFGTLWDTRSQKTLSERVAHSQLPHMQLIGLTPSTKIRPTALVLGIRDFALHKDLSLGEVEAIAVRDILGESTTPLLDWNKQATRKRLLSELPRHRIAHFSTHALPDRRAMLSHIVVKHEDGSDDTISALDLLEFKRPVLGQLVTLSACDTGQVRPGKTDDILGLPRAFLLAGTTAVVATLWRIPQESTKYLMVQFYSVLKTGGISVSAALAEAQRRTATKTDSNWHHPYYWGAAVVVGDGTLVPFRRSPADYGQRQ